ncbi:MAG TPA: DUF1653 domain-containing protein [Candidatus Norongarragalinales archaeon]|nr:DUF1653 domain-containing protein [Candidatus Norongarragalinales archaeon]
MAHKSSEEIERELKAAKTLVRVGGVYSHYKNSKHLVKVLRIGVWEPTDRSCVIYQEVANPSLVFARDLEVWLEEPLKDTPRFKLVEL